MNNNYTPPSNPTQVYSNPNVQIKFEDARDLPSITLYKIIIVLILVLSAILLSPQISRITESHLRNTILNEQLNKMTKELNDSKNNLYSTKDPNFVDKVARENGLHKNDEIAVILPEETVSTKGDETIDKNSKKQIPWYMRLYNDFKLPDKS